MCFLLVAHRMFAEAPLIVAANREEYYARPSAPPHLWATEPRVLGGTDLLAGGTWLAINEHGLLVAVTNRPWPAATPDSPSRGQLARELLGLPTAEAAAERALGRLRSEPFAGANFCCCDRTSAFVIEHGPATRIRRLSTGLHFLSNGDLDDAADPRIAFARGRLDERPPANAVELIDAARDLLAHPADAELRSGIIVQLADRGTVSSTIVSLTAEGRAGTYLHAAGPPDRAAYEDYSPLLAELLR